MHAIPHPTAEGSWQVPWDELQHFDWVQAWKDCPQDPIHHAEGNVWIHTRMVLEEMAKDPLWRALSERDRHITYLSAVLHDVAKPFTTKVGEDGRVSARGHSRKGSLMARKMLWEMGVPFALREQVCALISWHQVPYFLIEEDTAEKKLARLSQTVRCDLLARLATADIRGRICADPQAVMENIEMFSLYAQELGCWDQRLPFPSEHSRFLYFRGGNRSIYTEAFNDTRCEVVVMSGLPGTGKDSWIQEHLPGWPVVSLDNLRKELGIRPTDNQGTVIQLARERAREHMRHCQSFVWNATNLSRQRRGMLLSLFADYKAWIKLVYIEVPPERLFQQNRQREGVARVPEKVIRRMIHQWEVPDLTEAHEVQYVVADS